MVFKSMIKQPVGRTLAIGDVHGCLDALKTLEKFAGFCETDTIIALGDYIDRGSDSKGVIDWMIAAREKYNLITLLGNHEEMMEEARLCAEAYQFWTMNGGDQTLNSFECSIGAIPESYWEFIKSCKLFHETENHIFVHAGLEPSLPPEEQQSDITCWLRFRDLKPHVSNKTIICGHTPQRGNMPGILPHAVCIDTYAFNHKGYLTCLDIESGEYWQANNKRITHKSMINIVQKQS